MTQISAKIVADSKNEFGNRITTMILTFPRYILAEFNTHRMFSRNSASSRAIPFKKMLASVKENPFIPMAWQKDHSGMQGTEYLDDRKCEVLKSAWVLTAQRVAEQCEYMHSLGATKQMVNRPLEAYMMHTVLVTATEYENFFALRCPSYKVGEIDSQGISKNVQVFRSWKDLVRYQMNEKKCNRDVIEQLEAMTTVERLKCNSGQADIHMMALAEAMWDAFNESTPKKLKAGEWHIPFDDKIEDQKIFHTIKNPFQDGSIDTIKWKPLPGIDPGAEAYYEKMRIQISSALCARVSYTLVGEEKEMPSYENLTALHDRLAASGHWSPMEHCAQVMTDEVYINSKEITWEEGKGSMQILGVSGNFRGFIQYRKTFKNENIIK